MITKEEVLRLREAIPPRCPRGDPRNKQRIGPERRFNAAVKQYEKEHGISWFEDIKKGVK